MSETISAVGAMSSRVSEVASYRRNIALMFSGHSVSMLGTVIFNASLAWWVSENTGNTGAVAAVLAAASIPMIIANLIASFVIDRLNKKLILIATDLFCGTASIIFSVLALHGFNQTYAMITNAILAAGYVFISLTVKSIYPVIIPTNKLRRVNSIMSSTLESAKMFGGMLSGLFIHTLGAPGAFLFNGLSFLFSAFCEAKVEIPKTQIQQNKDSIKNEYIAGMKYLLRNKKIQLPIILLCASNIFSAAVPTLLPFYVKDILHRDSSVFAFSTGLIAGGAQVSSLINILFMRKSEQTSSFDLAAILSFCGIFLALNLIQSVSALYFSMFFYGLFYSRFNVFFTTYLQENCDIRFIGKLFSIVFTCASVFIPTGQFLFGMIGHQLLESAFPISGAFIITSSLTLSFLYRKINPTLCKKT